MQVCGAADGTCADTEILIDTASGRGGDVRCCSDTFLSGFTQYEWARQDGKTTLACPGVWAESRISGFCHENVTFCEAKSICESAGARLCTRDEVLNNCARSTGCGFDHRMIWTSGVETSDNSCERPDQTNVVCGDQVYVNKDCKGLEKVVDTTSYHPIRCCSDTKITGWLKKNGCNVWAETAFDDEALCYSKATYCEAKDFCASKGGRLCTKQEALNFCTSGSGCWFNVKKFWTSDHTPPPSTSPSAQTASPSAQTDPQENTVDPDNNPASGAGGGKFHWYCSL